MYTIMTVLEDFPKKYSDTIKNMGTYCEICGEKDMYQTNNEYVHSYCTNEDCLRQLSFCQKCKEDAESEYPNCPDCNAPVFNDF